MSSSYREIIGNYPFRVLWLAQIISQIAMNMLSFVLAIQVYQKTFSNTAVSLMLLTFGIPSIVFGVLAGGIVDRFDKRKILMFCNLGRFFILMAYAFFHENLLMLYLLSIAVSILTQLFIPAEAPSIPQLLPKKNLMPANSLFTITFYLSTIIGSIAAGPFLGSMGSRTVFLVMAAFMFIAYLLTSRLPGLISGNKTVLKLNFPGLIKPIFEGLVFIYRHQRIKHSLYLMTFSQSLIVTLAVLAPGFAHRILMTDIKDASLLVLGPAALGIISGALLVGSIGNRFLKGSLILTGLIMTGVSLILLAILSMNVYGPMLYFIMLLLFVTGLSNSLINVPTSTILQQESETGIRGRIYGVMTSLTGGFSILPVLFSGLMADYVGISRTLVVIGMIVLGTAVFYFIKRNKLTAYQQI